MSLTLAPAAPPLRPDSTGTLRVGSTRVAFESVVEAYDRGSTPDEIVAEYASLALADVHELIAYYLRHQDHVLEYVRNQEAARKTLLAEIRAEFPRENLRAGLAARRES